MLEKQTCSPAVRVLRQELPAHLIRKRHSDPVAGIKRVEKNERAIKGVMEFNPGGTWGRPTDIQLSVAVRCRDKKALLTLQNRAYDRDI